jgi:hypothetical protein
MKEINLSVASNISESMNRRQKFSCFLQKNTTKNGEKTLVRTTHAGHSRGGYAGDADEEPEAERHVLSEDHTHPAEPLYLSFVYKYKPSATSFLRTNVHCCIHILSEKEEYTQ